MRILLVIISFLSLVISGCTTKKNEVSSSLARKIKVDIDNNIKAIPFSRIFKESRFIKMQTIDEVLFENVNRVYLREDTLYFTNGTSILMFDSSGHYLNRIKRKGNGPSEYTSISDFDIYNRKIEVFNRDLKKILVYDLKGNFIEEKKINRWGDLYTILNNDYSILYSGNEIESDNSYKLMVLKKYKKVATYLKIDRRRSSYLNIQGTTNFSSYKGNVIFTEPFNDTVYTITSNEARVRYIIDINDSKKIPTDFFAKNYEYIFEFFNDLKKTSYAYGLFNFMESDSSLLFRYYVCSIEGINPINVCYSKQTGTSICFKEFYDDTNFKGVSLSLNEYDLFMQKDGSIVVFIPAYEFLKYMKDAIELSKKSKGVEISKQLLDIYSSTKINDNPIVCLLKLK